MWIQAEVPITVPPSQTLAEISDDDAPDFPFDDDDDEVASVDRSVWLSNRQTIVVHGPGERERHVDMCATAVRYRDAQGVKWLNDYELGSLIGTGTFGKVKRCTHKSTGVQYAVKLCKKRLLSRRWRGTPGKGPSALDSILFEIELLKRLCHANVVDLHEVINDPAHPKLYMVFELMKEGALMGNLMNADPLPLDVIRRSMRDILLGLEYLHARGIIHCDIKPDNLLVSDGVVKLSDFNVSQVLSSPVDRLPKPPGTPVFMSPESVEKDGSVACGAPTDMWALGVTLYAMVYGHPPFGGTNIVELLESIREDELELPQGVDPHVRDLVDRLLQRDVAKRITLDEMRLHPFIVQGGDLPSSEVNAGVVDGESFVDLI